MSRINARKMTQEREARANSHLNWMGGTSFNLNDPFLRLKMVAASSFFGEPKYYSEDGQKLLEKKSSTRIKSTFAPDIEHERNVLNAISPYEWRDMSSKEIIEKCIDECLDLDVEKTLNIAVLLRNEDMMRVTPQVILVRASNHPKAKGTGLISKYAPLICKRGDEPANGLAYQLSSFGRKSIPNSITRSWKKILESFDDYTISKYKMENNAVKTVDVCKLCHANSKPINKLILGKQKQKNTWNAVMSTGDNSTKEKTEKNWKLAMEKMPHMALLRNLRNLAENGVGVKELEDKLISGVISGKQLPFRYLSAYNSLKGRPSFQDAVEKCLNMSVNNIKTFRGKTMCLSDNSGSAKGAFMSEFGTMTVNGVGNLMSVITAKASEEGYVGIFGDNLDVIPIRKMSSVFDDVEKCSKSAKDIGDGTENGIWLFFDKAIKERQHWDNIFVYSDMQAGHGGLYGKHPEQYENYRTNGRYIDVAMLIKEYRKINPKVMIYLVQTAGYEDTLVPEFYNRTFIIGGWSSGILGFAHKMEEMFDDNF